MANFYGGSGNDTNAGSSGNDLSYGGAGNDSLSGGAGLDSLAGDLGDDVVDGGADRDVVVGGRGNDSLYGGAGNDEIIGDGQLYDPFNYASGLLLGLPTTLHVVNLADGPITLSYVDLFGNLQDVATIAAGQTYNYPTLTSANFFLLDAHGYYLDVIQGGNQTFTYSGPFADVLYGGDGDDSILGQTGNDTLYGDAGNDTLYGGYGDDSLSGGLGNDSLLGEAGNDTIYGGAGNDSLDAGSGNDLVYAGSGNDSVQLGDGNDVFGDWSIDESGDDTIYGGLGDDSIIGGAGNDLVYGGDGADRLSGQDGNDTLYGGEGADTFLISDDHNGDTIFGGETGFDSDTLLFGSSASTLGVTVTFSATEAGSYSFAGTSGSGVFSEIEVVYGTGFNDTLNGTAATLGLSLFGGAGDDSITGGSGSDTIYFGAGNDRVFGGAGNDIIDDVSGNLLTGENLVYGGAGLDTVWSGAGNDSVYGDADNDLLYGEAGNDFIYGGGDHDKIYGAGDDDMLFGDSGNDTLYGGTENDVLSGGLGNDSLYGGDCADWLSGDAGNDLLYGDLGNDVLFITTGGGTDSLYGGEDPGGGDRDTLQADHSGAVQITFTGTESGTLLDSGPSGGTSQFFEIEDIRAGSGNDTIDARLSTSGHQLAGNLGDDLILGGAGNDTLLGEEGNDSLTGEAGNDSLTGGAGNDSLTGGLGKDVFTFATGSGSDQIADFDLTLTAARTADQLNVSALLRADFAPVKVWDVTVLADGSGNAKLLFPSGETVVLQGISPSVVQQAGMLHAMGVPCFVRGTRIATPLGARPVEQIAQGDLVLTKQGAALPVIWRGAVQISAAELAQQPKLRPVLLPAAPGQAELWLSPQHGVLLPLRRALARAGHLADFGLARWQERPAAVVYHHLLLSQHALISAEGQWCESFYPGPMALAMLGPAARIAVTAAICARALAAQKPLTGDVLSLYGERCLPLLSRRDLRLWLARLGESPPPALAAKAGRVLEHPLP